MEFHPQKCQLLRITNKRKQILYDYTIHGETLQYTEDAKYLGVILDAQMKWKKHITSTASKANKTLFFLNRHLSHCPTHVKKQCYEVYVRPILEYSSTVWDPYHRNEIDILEKVQRRAARFTSKNFNPNVDSGTLVADLGWQTLAQRRKNNKLIMFHKALIGETNIPTQHLQNNNNRTRNSNYTFRLPASKIDAHLYSFFPSTIRHWNKLNIITKQQASSDNFRRSLLIHTSGD